MPVTRLLLLAVSACLAWGQFGGELRFCLRSDPKTFDPLAVADDSSETVRYLTGGVLVRVNRKTQQLEPELAESWKVAEGGRKIVFKLRERVLYSEGTPFSAEDVAFTVRRMMDPALHSPTGDSFRSGSGEVRAETLGPHRVSILFPSPIAGLERLFDQVAILSAVSPKAVLGPFVVAEHKAGSHLLLRRNPNYWKKDASGRRLPYLDSVRLDIQQNRDLEQIRFRRGEIHLIDSLDPETFDSLAAEAPASAIDAGPSLDTEMMWFNQVRNAPLPEYKKAWFRSKAFRRAVSESINRDDIARLVYRGHARPAVGPFSPSNRFWFHAGLRPHGFDPAGARRKLEQEGFRLDGAVLRDREGHPVEFSLVTNSGNKTRARIASLLQQDLAKVGIRLNIVPLDFPSLIERINRTFHYEACLLGLVNVDLDPNAQMNVWLSSAANHQWNPNQPSPATPWEAEIDRWMRAQASTLDPKKRKAAFDRVQEIVWEEAPFLYLANRNFLAAISPALRNTAPAAMRPQTFWNVERISFANQISGRR